MYMGRKCNRTSFVVRFLAMMDRCRSFMILTPKSDLKKLVGMLMTSNIQRPFRRSPFLVKALFAMLSTRTSSQVQYNLDFHGLNRRLTSVKRACGMKRAQSNQSLQGETRTFAEILDQEVEKVVLYYIAEQGNLAKKTWDLRSVQVSNLQDYTIGEQRIEDMLESFRVLGNEVLDLLEYLDKNVSSLRKIIQMHDACFDVRIGSVYFETRLDQNSKNPQLLPLYHQDGIRAIMSSIRRAFEDLHEAKNALRGETDVLFESLPSSTGLRSRSVPRISFGKRLASMGNLQSWLHRPSSTAPRHKSSSNLFTMLRTLSDPPEFQSNAIERSVSDLEPLLKRIDTVAERVMQTQRQSMVGVIAAKSAVELEGSLDDLQSTSDDGKGSHKEGPAARIHRFLRSSSGLYLNLLITFLSLANQYVVAPTSAEYARQLGMTPSMSGIIIGLSPAAALVSSLFYSMWSNYSFKQPLLLCMVCGIVGNIMYGMALQCDSAYLLLCGRLVVGFGGPRVITRRFIADHVPAERRLLASSQFVTSAALGLACGPLISSFVSLSGQHFTLETTLFGAQSTVWLVYTAETAPGWIMAVLWAVTMVLVVAYFQEPDQRYMRGNQLLRSSVSIVHLEAYGEKHQSIEDGDLNTNMHDFTHTNTNTRLDKANSVNPLKPALKGTELPPRPRQSIVPLHINSEHSSSNGSLVNDSQRSTPVNLTPQNNNVFNLNAEGMQHAIPRNNSNVSAPVVTGSNPLSHHSSYNTFEFTSPRETETSHLLRNKHGYVNDSPEYQYQTTVGPKTHTISTQNNNRHTSQNSNANTAKNEYFTVLRDEPVPVPAPAPEVKPRFWDYLTPEVLVILFVYTVNKTGQELVVSSIPLLTHTVFQWSVQSAGYYMAVVGALVLPMVILLNRWVNNVEERSMMLYLSYAVLGSIFLLCHSPALLGQYTVGQYILGSALLFSFLNSLEGVIMTLLAKVISPELAKGTFNSGLLATEAGTFGRVLGDCCITLFGAVQDSSALANQLFIPFAVMVFISVALVHWYFDQLL